MKTVPNKLIAGIDFGKKFSGQTVLCFLEDQTVTWRATEKNQNADKYLLDQLTLARPSGIFIDAPLSLPGVYTLKGNYQDYFYREADRQLKAMSPMFLAGLSARSIRLKDTLVAKNLTCYEAYPGGLAEKWKLKDHGYKDKKRDITPVKAIIQDQTPLNLDKVNFPDWHHIDALLAALSGLRFYQGIHQAYGHEEEGQILI